MSVAAIPLGAVVAERSFTLHDDEGHEKQITVRLGAPIPTTSEGAPGTPAEPGERPYNFRCPFQIIGLDYGEKIFAPFGDDPFIALHYAIDLIGGLIDNGVKRLKPAKLPSWLSWEPGLLDVALRSPLKGAKLAATN